MFKQNFNKKGLALYLVLSTILIVVILANVVLNIISSQSRLTHHQVSRIQAYYAALAGMNLAFTRLRTGTWGTGSYTLCRTGCDVNDASLPDYPVNITIGPVGGGISGTRELNITSVYTYIMP